ncbi:MAG: hypothetical protein K8T10_08845 [Candidatus Eremiobacteraeota bacterium]|nr:hypothetical protein [Candidatus Eremiobacteraeota bacterium]
MPAEEKKIYAITTPDFLKISNDKELSEILERRWKEVKICIEGEAFLSSIVMMGGILEGLFLSIVTQYSREANKSKCSPKDKRGKVKKFGDWKLSEFINVAYDLGWIQSDAKDFSSSLRCYRNLIHPYEQRLMAHYPDEDTAKICLQVIQATINDLLTHIDNINKEVKGN